ncbi:MAG: PACE efflux transporter [Piscinibacter sp.]|nr:PACE efflux transporter [Piscinibacter sp.]
MSSITPPRPKSARERMLQAFAYEGIAILVCTLLFAALFGTGWSEMGVVTLANCAIALAWNMAFNAAFDRLLQRLRRRPGLTSRALHALLFEGGLGLLCVPFAAWWLGISWPAALALDVGLLLFFLPYTFIFHVAWDRWRESRAAAVGPRGAPRTARR